MIHFQPHPSISKFLASHDILSVFIKWLPKIMYRSSSVNFAVDRSANSYLNNCDDYPGACPPCVSPFKISLCSNVLSFTLFVPCLRYLPTTFSQHQHPPRRKSIEVKVVPALPETSPRSFIFHDIFPLFLCYPTPQEGPPL